MGLTTPEAPPVDPATFLQTPYRERLKIMSRHWVEYGFGSPKIVMLIYIAKVLLFYVLVGVLACTLTSGLDPLEPGRWWDEPIVWQKVVIWTMLLEAMGVAGSWGPLAGHFKPMTGGILYYARTGTLRNPPWPGKVPFTAGDERTPVDVALYLGVVLGLALAIALPGHEESTLTEAVGANEGLVAPASIVPVLVLLGLLGLRDKISFLQARSEQWAPALIFFALFGFVDMIVAAKLLIVFIWFGAGISKLNRHFEQVIPPMVSNTPWNPFKAVKRAHYRDFPDDLRPSKASLRLTHVGGAVGELIPPMILLFSQTWELSVAVAVFMICYHVFITSTFPLAVPIEWNVAFMFITAFLFIGFPAHEGYWLDDMDTALLIATAGGLLVLPVLGELRPDLVSFLPALRQYSGNWASAMWAFAPGCEQKLDDHITKPAKMQKGQLADLYDPDTAEVLLYQLLGWRSMHSQARGMNSVMINHLGQDIDTYTLREAEFSCNAITGFNFGDGHFHDHRLIAAMQKRCNFAPGEFIVVWVESEPIFNGRQQYMVIDAAMGIVERGSWAVQEAVNEQPWLPNGPISTQVNWRMDGYERVSHCAGELPPREEDAPDKVPA